jgi:hypothetical protein
LIEQFEGFIVIAPLLCVDCIYKDSLNLLFLLGAWLLLGGLMD